MPMVNAANAELSTTLLAMVGGGGVPDPGSGVHVLPFPSGRQRGPSALVLAE
jgi:hypothetical protein